MCHPDHLFIRSTYICDFNKGRRPFFKRKRRREAFWSHSLNLKQKRDTYYPNWGKFPLDNLKWSLLTPHCPSVGLTDWWAPGWLWWCCYPHLSHCLAAWIIPTAPGQSAARLPSLHPSPCCDNKLSTMERMGALQLLRPTMKEYLLKNSRVQI